MDVGRTLLPVNTPEEFINAVIEMKRPEDKPKVTSILLNLFPVPFHHLEGRSLLENLAAFKSTYGDEVNKLTENVLKLKQADFPSAELEGVALLRKNEQLSTSFRGNGNAYFKAGDLPMALRCYTLAACYAPPGSHAERLAYSNRSACFAELGNWRKCLEEIALFEKVDSGVVEPALREKIGKRKNKCLVGVGASKNLEVGPDADQRFAKELLTTLKNENKLIPGAEEFVGIRRDAVKGRCLYNKGKSPIEPGTLIMVDKACGHAVKGSLCFETGNCNACQRQLNGSGIPCPSCVFHIYCSKACAAQSDSKYECQVLPYLYDVEYSAIGNMRLALFILFKLGPEGLLSHLRQAEEGGGKPIPGLNPEGLYDPKSFETVINLSSTESMYVEGTTMEACLFAVFATKIVDETTDYFRSLKKVVQPDLNLIWVKDEFARLLVRLSAICTINCVGIGKRSDDLKTTREKLRDVEVSIFGIGLFPVMSLLNHSCSPNVVYIGLPDGLMAIVTTQHIAPGQEFLTDYAHCFPTPKEKRQAHLLKLYGFTCNCPPCKFDWVDNVYSGTICPNCRPYRDIDANGMEALEEIRLEETSSYYNCPQCPWRMSKVDHAMMNSGIGLLAETAASNMCAMKGLRTAFCDMQKVVKYCDSTLMKPDGFLGANDDVLVHLLQLFAAKLWDSC